VIPGDLGKNESAQVSANLLEPGPVFLEPFGQKERRSAEDGSRLFFSLEIGPGKSPGAALNPPIFVRMLKAKCHREPKIPRITAGFIRVLADLTETHWKFVHFCHIWCVPFGFCNPIHTNFVRIILLFFSKIHTFWLPTYFGGFLGPTFT
jgi:hypothetical protein